VPGPTPVTIAIGFSVILSRPSSYCLAALL
jgi:hypothetical protein